MFKYYLTIIFLFSLDRFFKLLFILKPSLGGRSGFFDLSINQNIAFSLPLSYFLLYPFIFLILFFLLWQLIKAISIKSRLIWPWALIIIGAISNLIDRLKYGGVIDFINVPYFTVLNVADIYISVGAIWIIWHTWFYRQNRDGVVGNKKS